MLERTRVVYLKNTDGTQTPYVEKYYIPLV